jgi:hypothetical protein
MPCRDWDLEANSVRFYQDKLQLLTRVACDLNKFIHEASKQYPSLLVNLELRISEETSKWLEDHQRADAERSLQAQRERAIAYQREQIIAKLSPEERKLLGL